MLYSSFLIHRSVPSESDILQCIQACRASAMASWYIGDIPTKESQLYWAPEGRKGQSQEAPPHNKAVTRTNDICHIWLELSPHKSAYRSKTYFASQHCKVWFLFFCNVCNDTMCKMTLRVEWQKGFVANLVPISMLGCFVLSICEASNMLRPENERSILCVFWSVTWFEIFSLSQPYKNGLTQAEHMAVRWMQKKVK